MTKNRKKIGVAETKPLALSENLDEYVVSQPPMPVSIPTFMKLNKVMSHAAGAVQMDFETDSGAALKDCFCSMPREQKNIKIAVAKNNPAKMKVGKLTSRGSLETATNGWLKIAPTPQKKFKTFSAVACLCGLISAMIILIEVRVEPIPIPKTTNPRKQNVQSFTLIIKHPKARASVPNRIENKKPKRLIV